jgi:hypothetical protein
MSIVAEFYTICAARFILGFACGVILCATPKALDEVLPSELIDKGFGTSTNIVINLSFLQVMIMANYMPDDKKTLVTTNYWQVLFTVQVPFQLLALFLHIFVFKEETIDFNVKAGNEQGALSLISKVYPYIPKHE